MYNVIAIFSLIGLLSTVAVRADETPTAEQIDAWVKQLDHDDFAKRQEAQIKLKSAGKSAIDAVGKAALGKSQEAAVRAIEILKGHLRGEDEALRAAAEQTLGQIAESDNDLAAKRANHALQPEPDKEPAAEQPQGLPIGPRIIPFGGGGGIRIEAHAIEIGGRGGKWVTVKKVDGKKEITAEDDQRKVKIVESADGKIVMQVVEKVGDMEKTNDYEADSVEELKKKHPEAHKIYEKYSQGGGARIEFRALPAGPGAPRIKVLPFKGGDADEIEKRADEIRKRAEEMRKRIEGRHRRLLDDVEGKEPQPEVGRVRNAIEQLQRVQKQLEENDAIPAEVKEQIKQVIKELEESANDAARDEQ